MDIKRGDMICKRLEREERTDRAPSPEILVDDDDGVNGGGIAGVVGRGGMERDDEG